MLVGACLRIPLVMLLMVFDQSLPLMTVVDEERVIPMTKRIADDDVLLLSQAETTDEYVLDD